MTITEQIILSAIVCLCILAAVLTYDPIDRYQFDQWRLDSYGK